MYIIDSHCDSIQRTDKKGWPLKNRYNMSEKHLQAQFFAMFCCWPRETPEQSYDRMMRYTRLFEQQMQLCGDYMVQCRTGSQIEQAFRDGKNAAILTLEGGSGLMESTEILDDMYRRGARVCGLTWADNALGCSNRAAVDTGLTASGLRIARRCLELGMIIDVSHLSDRGFYRLCELSDIPFVATHSNFREICGHSRNLTRDMALEIKRRGGMIGMANLCVQFLREDKNATVDDVLRHIDYALDLLGDGCIGFGFDADGTSDVYPGGFSMERSLHDTLLEQMDRRYPAATVARIAGGNWMDFLKANLG